jgi:undecaprenyl-diphosphatase
MRALGWLVDILVRISDSVYLALNGLAGRSWLFDTLVALAIDNDLVKAAPVCAAFVFAWYSTGDAAAAQRARRILVVTLGALFVVLAVSKATADSIFLPRPFVQSQQTYHLEDGALVAAPRIAYRVPQAGFSHGRYERLKTGEIEGNDLNTFPSDHAAFYFALALGIAFASRAAGLLAIGWTLIVILASRIVTGTHSPLDIVAGIALGGVLMVAAQLIAARWMGRLLDPLAAWTFRWPGLSAALVFLAMFEAGNTLENLRHALRAAKAITERMLGL